MRIVTYAEVDPDEVFQLTLASFGWGLSEGWVRNRRRRDSRVLDEFAVYAIERGRPLAQIIPMKTDVRLTGGVETVGAIQAVCSHPSVWGKGYARRLMEHVHRLYRDRGYRIATLLTSRNIRGYRLYRGLGYVDLTRFYRGSRRIVRKPAKSQGIRLKKARRSDLPRIQEFFERYVRGLTGWTVRPPGLLEMRLAWDRTALDSYRIVFRDGNPVGYLRTKPADHQLADEVMIPREADFRAVMRTLERQAPRRIATVSDVSARRDIARFQSLGYDLTGPTPFTTMAVSLESSLPTAELPRLFGATTGRFVIYATDEF